MFLALLMFYYSLTIVWATQTNKMSASVTNVSFRYIPLVDTRKSTDDLMLRFSQELEQNGTDIYSDKISGYSAVLQINNHLDKDGYGFHNWLSSRGSDLFAKTFLNSFRETMIDCLDLEDRLGETQPFHFFSQMFEGSVGRTAEERVELDSPNMTESEIRRTWFQRLRSQKFLHYGVRPFRTSPYVFVGTSIGKYDGRPIAVLDARAYSLLENEQTGLMRLQFRGTVPISKWSQIIAGVNLYPTDNSDEYNPSFTLGYGTLVGKNHSNIVYLGSRFSQEESAVTLGFAMVW